MLVIPGVITVIGLVTAFWGSIVRTFRTWIIPTLRARLGDGVADAVATLLAFIDRPMCAMRRAAGAAIGLFREKVLGLEKEYRDRGRVVETVTEVLLVHETNPAMARKVVMTEEMPYHEIPNDVRDRMNRTGQNEVPVDVRRGVEEKVAEADRKLVAEMAT